ncbi:hypothetical protein F4680DRAFT_422581 [Xylaria scruposa]|nr:hypothetical protein F4680DRAFT_422581 [Xylaria scruposa]
MREPINDPPPQDKLDKTSKKSKKLNVEPGQFIFIVEAKRSAKNNGRVTYQVTAQLAGWIYSRREELKEAFKKHGNSRPQHLLLAQFCGTMLTFHIASFRLQYLEYLDTVDPKFPKLMYPKAERDDIASYYACSAIVLTISRRTRNTSNSTSRSVSPLI